MFYTHLSNTTFPTIADIPPLNEEEVERGIEILNTDLSWIYHKYGGALPSEESHLLPS